MANKTITIEVDAAVARAVEKKLKERGTDLETYFRLQIRALSRNKIVIHLYDQMPFGKFAGEKVEDIVRAETSYMQWLFETSKNPAQWGEDVVGLLNSLTDPKPKKEQSNGNA